jgi:hypothetical protein
MNKKTGSLLLTTILGTAVLAISLKPGRAKSANDVTQVEGRVRDIACPL